MPEQKDIESAAAASETAAPSGHDMHDDHGHGEVGVESESVDVKLIAGVVIGTVLVVVGFILVGFTITEVTSRELRADVISQTVYPEIREARAEATAKISQYEVIDAENGVYRIPIDRAIDLMVNEQYQAQPVAPYSEELTLVPAQ